MLLSNMRNNTRSLGILILFGIIIVVFIFSFGPASNGCRSGAMTMSRDNVATVNGKEITRQQFERAYARQLADIQRRSGNRDPITREMADQYGMGSQLLDQLINTELLYQAATDEGMRISDDEVAEEINKVDAFKVNGVFSQENYRSIVEGQLGMQTWQFEDQLRRDLLIQKKVGAVRNAVRISDDEVKAEFIREKEIYALSLVRFPFGAQKSAINAPTLEDIDAYAKANPGEISKFYEDNKGRYNQSKQVRARHILIKTGGAMTVEQATAKIQELKDRIVKGEDFAEIAKVESQDPGSKIKGGDLGKFGEGVMVPEFQAAAFALKAGEISDPVVSKFGVHLIKVEEVFEPKVISLEEATRDISRELLIASLAKAKTKELAEDTLAQVRSGKKLSELWPADPGEGEAAVGKPRSEETGDFRLLGTFIPRIGTSEEIANDLPTMALGPADKVYETNDEKLVVLVLDKHDKPDLSLLTDDVKNSIRDRLTAQRTETELENFVKALKEKAKIVKDPAIAAPGNIQAMLGL